MLPFVWQLAILLLMAFVANTKVWVQGRTARASVKNGVDTVAYNGLLFAFAALSFFVIFFEPRFPSLTTLLLAVSFGAASVLFQLSYLQAMKTGPVSLTVLVNNFSVVITSLFGVFAYGESFSAFKLVGLLLVLGSFVLTVKPDAGNTSFHWKWLCLSLGATLSGALGSIFQKIHQNTAYSEERSLFVTYAYFLSTVISVLVVGGARLKGQQVSFRITPSLWLPAAFAGLMLGVYQFLALWMAEQMESMVMYPIHSCFCILVSFLFGVVFFKDRLTLRQWIGSGVGIAAVVLISL